MLKLTIQTKKYQYLYLREKIRHKFTNNQLEEEKTGISVTDWLEEVQNMGCGEILLTSVDHEGTLEGFDLELISEIKNKIKVPLIFSGGFGKIEHLNEALKLTKNISMFN